LSIESVAKHPAKIAANHPSVGNNAAAPKTGKAPDIIQATASAHAGVPMIAPRTGAATSASCCVNTRRSNSSCGNGEVAGLIARSLNVTAMLEFHALTLAWINRIVTRAYTLPLLSKYKHFCGSTSSLIYDVDGLTTLLRGAHTSGDVCGGRTMIDDHCQRVAQDAGFHTPNDAN
jgi:hypothetical protein